MIRKLNFGAGKDIRNDWDNVDKEDFDFNKFPYPIKTNVYDEIEIRQVLQLLDNPERVLQELWRISKNNSIIIFKRLILTIKAPTMTSRQNIISTKIALNFL